MIHLNFRDAQPIYEQIKQNIRDLIISGGLQAGDKLQSVRELSVQLAINPNTIQRAYRELEAEGYIYSVPGKGSFVAGQNEVVDNRKRELLEQFRKTVRELRYVGVDSAELMRLMEEGGEAK